MSLPRYESYKDSGVEWLGEVPEHWEVQRLRFATMLNPSKNETANLDRNTLVSFLPMEAIGVNGELNTEIARSICDVDTGYTYFRNGDVTIAKITPCFENGKGAVMNGLVTGVGFGTTELIVVRPKESSTISEYLYWLFTSTWFRKLGEASMYGAGGQKRVPDEFVRNFFIGLPLVSEQEQICTFLTQETAKIDNLIAEQQQLIKLLKEKRQAVISHAVTKGLNPDVPMKDSGVEWLGEVPAHWDIVPLKYLCKFSGGGTPSKENLSYWTDGNIPWVSPKDMKSFWLSDTQDKLTAIAVNESSTNYVESGALLMVVRSGILQRMIPIAINTVRVTLNQDMKALRFNLKMNVEFAANFILGYQLPLLLEWSKEGATVESIEYEYLSNSLFPVPPIEEQETINESIKSRIEAFQSLEDYAVRVISLSKERRSALISSAVTGKIDVRNYVSTQPQVEAMA